VDGTVGKSGATCLKCQTSIPFSYIRAQGREGKVNYQMMAIVVSVQKKRVYLEPDDNQVNSMTQINTQWSPDTDMPNKALGFRVQQYGLTKHRGLFTQRQLVALATFCELVTEVHHRVILDSKGNNLYADAISTFW
jgi:putative DNA methylase